MTQTASDIDRKLCVTAALVGAVTRKDLAAAFRRVNPQTSFDVERAHKWLQGRARPREQRLYDDWARLLDVGRPGDWIADCELAEFVDLLCRERGHDREALLRRARAFGGADGPRAAPGTNHGASIDAELIGVYACYSNAWSPYFEGRLIRGALVIARASNGTGPLKASYAETLPNVQVFAEGTVSVLRQALHLDLREAQGRGAFLFSLFPPTLSVSVLAGLMCGPTLLGPEPQPSVTRIVIVRLPAPHPNLPGTDAYLASGASIAADLAGLGAPVSDPAAADRLFAEILGNRSGDRIDSIPIAAHRALVDFFDREWIGRAYPVD